MKLHTWLHASLLAALLVVGGNATADATTQGSLADSASVPAAPAGAEVGEGKFWSFSYTMGFTLGSRLRGDIPETDLDALMTGVRDAFAGTPPRVDEAQMRAAAQEYGDYRQQQETEQREKLAAANLEKANAFLAQNGKRKGVKTTKSGLQYEVQQKASGKGPQPTDIVTAHYHGTLVDGTVFDSSREGEPVDFPLNRVIPGWTEGLQLMAKGAKFKFFVPPGLAYGARGIEDAIGPNQVLVFEVELIDFKAPPPPEPEPEANVEPAAEAATEPAPAP